MATNGRERAKVRQEARALLEKHAPSVNAGDAVDGASCPTFLSVYVREDATPDNVTAAELACAAATWWAEVIAGEADDIRRELGVVMPDPDSGPDGYHHVVCGSGHRGAFDLAAEAEDRCAELNRERVEGFEPWRVVVAPLGWRPAGHAEAREEQGE